VRFVKNDGAFEFDVRVPADATLSVPPKPVTTEPASRAPADDAPGAIQQQQRRTGAGDPPRPGNRTLQFEYDLATARLTHAP
jgi:hypothetical protein